MWLNIADVIQCHGLHKPNCQNALVLLGQNGNWGICFCVSIWNFTIPIMSWLSCLLFCGAWNFSCYIAQTCFHLVALCPMAPFSFIYLIIWNTAKLFSLTSFKAILTSGKSGAEMSTRNSKSWFRKTWKKLTTVWKKKRSSSFWDLLLNDEFYLLVIGCLIHFP